MYIAPPADGIYEFSFNANRPDGIVAQGFESIQATYNWLDAPPGLRGVRIYASSNAKEAHLLAGSGKVCVRGVLTDEGVECQAMRAESGELYTLVGDLTGVKNGDHVYVSGAIAEISFCMQGVTIAVDWISKDKPRAK